MLTIPPSNLVLRDNDLGTVRVLGARDLVLEDTDGADDLAGLNDANLALVLLASTKVAGVADDLLGLDGFVAAADSDELALAVGDDLVDGLVQHICTTVDGT